MELHQIRNRETLKGMAYGNASLKTEIGGPRYKKPGWALLFFGGVLPWLTNLCFETYIFEHVWLPHVRLKTSVSNRS